MYPEEKIVNRVGKLMVEISNGELALTDQQLSILKELTGFREMMTLLLKEVMPVDNNTYMTADILMFFLAHRILALFVSKEEREEMQKEILGIMQQFPGTMMSIPPTHPDL